MTTSVSIIVPLPPLLLPPELSVDDVLFGEVVEGGDVTTTRPLAVPKAANLGCTQTLVGKPSPLEEEVDPPISPPELKRPPKTLLFTTSDTSRTGAIVSSPMIDDTDA